MFANGVHANENVPIATRGSIISTAIKKFGAKNLSSAFLRNVLTSFFVFSSERKTPKIDHYYNVVMDPQVLLIIIYDIVILSDIGLAQQIFVKIT